MHIDWWTLALQAVNVLILVGLLSRFLYRPVMAIIAARQDAARTLLADAQAAKEAAVAETAALKARDDIFATEAGRRRAAMDAEIARERDRLLIRTRADAEASAKQVADRAEVERARMAGAWQDKAGLLAGHMAQTLLARLPARLTMQVMFDALTGQLSALSQESRRELAQDAPLLLLTPARLDEADQQRYRAALEALFATSLAMEFSVDPDLLAGFELHGAHIRIRNSWRADLDGMLATLGKDGHAAIG